jgi:hypothetical protein
MVNFKFSGYKLIRYKLIYQLSNFCLTEPKHIINHHHDMHARVT